jgi:hypothetical protein
MLVLTRRGLVFPLLFSLAACSSALQGGGTTPAAGNGVGSGADAAGGHVVFQKLDIHPDAASPPLLMNFVSDGPAQGGVPCISCVNGASTSDTIGLTGPSSYVLKNFSWQYSLSFTDISYKGKCKLNWTITNAGKTIDAFSATFNLTSSGGFVLYALNRSRPKYSGPATLTGKYTCGKNTQSTHAPLQFQ